MSSKGKRKIPENILDVLGDGSSSDIGEYISSEDENEQQMEIPSFSGKRRLHQEDESDYPVDVNVNQMKRIGDANPPECEFVLCDVESEQFTEAQTEPLITARSKIKWTQRNVFQPIQSTFNDEVTMEIEPVHYPLDYFLKYIPESFINDIVKYTNMYALQNNDNGFRPTNNEEIKAFLGLNIMMGNLKLPRIRLYWDNSLKIAIIHDTMPINRFFKLRNYIHCLDTNVSQTTNADKMWKIRPLYECVRKRMNELPVEKYICVDEQMVPYRGRCAVKQYMKGKPNPWGIKIFMLCGQSGLCYDFIIYQGKTTELGQELVDQYGFAPAVVLHLTKRLCGRQHQLYFDNYFTSYNLLEVLRQNSILAAGTARVNRFSKPPLLSDKDIKKKGRGYSHEVFAKNGDIVLVQWLDNKSAVLASNYIGVGEIDSVQRWNKVENRYENVSRPQIVRDYNASMGGVDLFDFLIALYRIEMKSRKWTVKMFFHAIDLVLANSWLEYRQHCTKASKDILDLLHFRQRVAESLIKSGQQINVRKRGRSSSSSVPSSSTRHPSTSESRPIPEVQYDSTSHLPEHTNGLPVRCKNKNCNGKSRWKCEKCNVHLCLQKNKNCFRDFHKK